MDQQREQCYKEFYLPDRQPAWPTVRSSLGAAEQVAWKRGEALVGDGRPPSFLGLLLPKLQPKGTKPGPQAPWDLQALRASQAAKRCREKPTLTARGAAPTAALPTTSCRHRLFRFAGCGFARICLSERLGEYSRTIKYSPHGSCSISMPIFIQPTLSEGLPGARRWWTNVSVSAGKAGGRGGSWAWGS